MNHETARWPSQPGERLLERDDIDRLTGLVERFGAAPLGTLPRVLIAVDGTEVTEHLVAEALRWGQQYQWRAEVHLLFVHDYLAKEAAERLLPEVGMAETAGARAQLAAAGVPCTLHILMGNPAPRILERAAELDAALILMGTRGHGALGSALLGSVAHKVVQGADRPVTLVRA
jgi:nucleotide-binding universal stress UspA family protein